MKKQLVLLLPPLLLLACALVSPRVTPAPLTPTALQMVQPAATLSPLPTPSASPTEPPPPFTPTTRATQAPSPTFTSVPPTPIVPGAIARQHLYFISEEIGPRPAGSEAETQTAQYLQSILEDLGYPVQLQPFTKVGWVGEDERETRIRSANVIATKAGASEQMIVIGAHYDSVSVGHGADDNASGVAVLLELAETLRDTPTPYTLRFVAFGAEEVGPLGSDAYVEQLSATERRNTIAMINLDSVTAGDHLYVYSIEGQGAVVRDWALAWATQNGIVLQTIPHIDLSDEDGYPTADYAAFQNVGIPFAYFEATNWALGDQDGYTQVDPQYGDYGTIFHTEFDRLAYLDETFPGRVDEHLELVIRIVQAILTQFKLD